MKKLLALLLSAMMTVSMAACGSQPAEPADSNASAPTQNTEEEKPEETKESDASSEEPVEISFWHAMSGPNEEAIKKITDDFMAENPNIKVTLMNQGGYRDLFDKLMASAKADRLP